MARIADCRSGLEGSEPPDDCLNNQSLALLERQAHPIADPPAVITPWLSVMAPW